MIDARVRPGEQGGVQQAVMGLAWGLGQLEGPERYEFLVEGAAEWLRPFVSGPCVAVPTQFPTAGQQRTIATAERVRSGAGVALRYLAETRGRVLPTPDPVVVAQDPDVVHFVRHRGWRTSRPNLYVPHDLQHVDLPDLFSSTTRAYRRVVYGAMAAQATKIVALTAAQVEPLATHYGRPQSDVVVVPWASILTAYPIAANLPEGVPRQFALYPAATWPHKNHLRLVEALANLRDDGLDVPVVLTGSRTEHWDVVAARSRQLGVADLLVHLGYVEEGTLRRLYAEARMVVFPSTYEGFGLPIVEALDAGTPVVCADLPSLRTLAGDAGRPFDPTSVMALATAMSEVWTDPSVRDHLAACGRARGERLTWKRTAVRYRALYRMLAGCASSEDDAVLQSAHGV